MKNFLSAVAALLLFPVAASAIDFDDGPIEEGYRGFVDFSYTLGVGDGYDRVNLMTSHGWQIAPQFFAGVGVGVNYFYDAEECNFPVFAHFRSDILNNDVTPYVDLRVGYSFGDLEGMYINPSVGCRFALSDSIGLSVGVGYTMQKADYYDYYGYYSSDKKNCGGVDFRFGIDF